MSDRRRAPDAHRRQVAELLVLLAVLLAVLASRAHAQRRPDWRVWREAIDQYGVGELRAPRVVHQALGAALTAETYRGLRALRVPSRVAAPAAGLGVGLAPHVVGVSQGRYPFDPADWAADLWIRGGSAVVMHRCARKPARTRPGRGWTRCTRAVVVYLAGSALAAGWASP